MRSIHLLRNMTWKKSNLRCCVRLLKTSFAEKSEKSKKRLDSTTEIVKKKKTVIIRKSYPSDLSDSVVLESKNASAVIKKLNWEFKHLFGPLLTGETYEKKRNYESNKIIQHQTLIPILDPPVISDLDAEKPQAEKLQTDGLKNESVFNLLLKFPLMNKPNFSEQTKDLKINDLNFLRKELETLSQYQPSVSVILEKTMPKESVENLNRWRQKMIDELGEEGFQKYHAEILANGVSFHECINGFLTTKSEAELNIKEAIKGHWKSLKHVFPCVSDIKLMEERISHPFLRYRGVVDCFAKYKDQLVVIEWKTSKKAKTSLKSTFDNPLQVAAYVGALNFDPKFQYLANRGLLVVAYENGEPATTLMIDEEKMLRYWKEWLNRVKMYWEIVGANKNSEN